ncbi:unnamed protein product [Lymnaea stagnalis]|uniref:Ig-like domain-containing protein n=1 Tax=Lymnaea stagnalis TaxID=6523 RepID=A0AAV2HN99_LYMST
MEFLFLWQILQLFFTLTVHFNIVYSMVDLNKHKSLCPHSCACVETNELSTKLTCEVSTSSEWENTCKEIHTIFSDEERGLELKLSGNAVNFIHHLSCLPELKSLDISNTSLKLRPEVFKGLRVTSSLKISSNGIKSLPEKVFHGLDHLSELDMSHNEMNHLEPDTFSSMHALTSFDVSFNSLTDISLQFFSSMTSLQRINFEYNAIDVFSAQHIANCTGLESLNLHHNRLKSLIVSENDTEVLIMRGIKSLDISENPLECSCVIGQMLRLLPELRPVLMSPQNTLCSSPDSLVGKRLVEIESASLLCSSPHSLMTTPKNTTSVLTTSSVTFQCAVKGFPQPSIIWKTPWGELFSKDKFPDEQPDSSLFGKSISMRKKYEEPNVDIVSSIHIDSTGNLIIKKIRGSMSGNFTCLALNVAGNVSLDLEVLVFTNFIPIAIQSQFIGAYCATGFLVIGILVGLIKMAINQIRHKLYFIVPLLSKSPSTHHPGDMSCGDSVLVDVTNSSGSQDGSFGQEATVTSPLLIHRENSNESNKHDAGDGSYSPKDWRPKAIFESLEDARGKLRYGVGRKMERVRKNVQSIKESGSVYVHSIVETGSSAASRMKAGVVMGVETVKCHVQSIKELCGTGYMGTQTISMVSVETDVDSNERREVIKQVTFV